MFGTILLTSFVVPLLAQTSTPINPAWKLRVSTPTFHADSERTGVSSAGYQITAGTPLVTYPYSGRSLCLSSSAVLEEPDDAGFGWRVQIVPLRNDGGTLVAQVEWQRLWYRGEKLANGLKGTIQVTIKPGQHIMFDYMAAAPTNDCHAIGMGLEVGLDPLVRTEVVEADLWLVRALPNGTEQSQHQTMRLSPGAGADFYFDDITLQMQFFFNANGPTKSVTVRTSGRLTLVDVAGGTSQIDVKIGQDILGDASRTGGSSTFRLKASPNDVLAVQVPRVAPDAERMSLRLQLRQIR